MEHLDNVPVSTLSRDVDGTAGPVGAVEGDLFSRLAARARSSRGFSLLELMVVVLIISILAMVAYPSFMRYMRRARISEPILNLRKLYDISQAYYYADHANGQGALTAKQFPVSMPATPAPLGGCCADPSMRCLPSKYANQWQSPTWETLNFSMDDPFYYSYNYDSAGSGSSAMFTVTAQGDLNCDGKLSLFQRIGWIQDNHVTGGGQLYWLNELE
jgi:prepilin-type N-terminal cleavage/methylation domain-containing protein